MNCFGCDNSGYRKLCNYDDINNNCGNATLNNFSFECVGTGANKKCVRVNKPPGNGRYATEEDCRRNCMSPLGQFSYKCVGSGNNQQCVRVNEPPGPGLYTTMDECQRKCQIITQNTSYQCVGTGYGSGGAGKQCIQVNLPPGNGRFSSYNDCQRSCGFSGGGGGNTIAKYIGGEANYIGI
jgi:hypothetical protein